MKGWNIFSWLLRAEWFPPLDVFWRIAIVRNSLKPIIEPLNIVDIKVAAGNAAVYCLQVREKLIEAISVNKSKITSKRSWIQAWLHRNGQTFCVVLNNCPTALLWGPRSAPDIWEEQLAVQCPNLMNGTQKLIRRPTEDAKWVQMPVLLLSMPAFVCAADIHKIL